MTKRGLMSAGPGTRRGEVIPLPPHSRHAGGGAFRPAFDLSHGSDTPEPRGLSSPTVG